MRRLILFILIFTCAPAALAQRVYVDYDREAAFGRFTSFALSEGTPAGSELIDKQLREKLRAALEEKGLEYDDDAPRLLVVTHVVPEGRIRRRGPTIGISIGTWGSHGGVSVGTAAGVGGVEERDSLTIELRDAESDELLWQADCPGLIKANPERTRKRIDRALRRAFKRFPPGK